VRAQYCLAVDSGRPLPPALGLFCSLRELEIAGALDLAQAWLRSESWWSDEEDAILSVTRDDGTWIVHHAMREYVEFGDEMAIRIGGYRQVGIRDDGRIIKAALGQSSLAALFRSRPAQPDLIHPPTASFQPKVHRR